jgi:gluconate 2-dehydrogenase gamma chain
MMAELSRRRFLQAASLAPLAALLPRGFIADALAAPATQSFAFFDAHQAAVVREATARLIPGPEDDPLEAGHPGAREANVVRYIDVMLGAFTFTPPRIHAGGPYSDRNGGDEDHMADFVPLTPFQEASWRKRIDGLQKTYVAGIKTLDAAAGGDFTTASTDKQDSVLAGAGDFLGVLFTNAIEGFFSAPEYGGNAGGVGWKEISFHGDTQPRGYTAKEVGESDGLNPVIPDALLLDVMAHIDEAAFGIVARRRSGR